MRVLLVAYQFSSMRSPRALRWHYLSRELASLGHEVHVLTPSAARGNRGDDGVRVHEVFPGPLAWMLARRARRLSATERPQNGMRNASVSATRLNWRGRLAKRLRWCLAQAFFPGEDAQWLPWARRCLQRLLDAWPPDIVISSHEPASSLMLGRQAKSRGLPWVIDLGDPVCAPYTAQRWRKKALRLEAQCMHEADCIIVPHGQARTLYMERHGVDDRRFFVLPQGYDDRVGGFDARQRRRSADMLELLFVGRIYPFRDPGALLQAVVDVPGVRLTMILADPPEESLSGRLASHPRVRLLPAMSHEEVYKAELSSDVLVSIGNACMPAQVPGKIFEYMGIPRPILHLYSDPDARDLPAELVEHHQRGWSCRNLHGPVCETLTHLVALARTGMLNMGLELAPVPQYAFSQQGKRLAQQLLRLASG